MASDPDRPQPSATTDLLYYERQAWERDHQRVAGIDEAGRGPLAGPVVAAAVVAAADVLEAEQNGLLCGLTDSKKLTPKRRDLFFDVLHDCPTVRIGVGIIDSEEIDEINILEATHSAMRQAVNGLDPLPDLLLVDGRPVPGLPVDSLAVVKGDQLSLLIAAASVVAKVTRDRIMLEYDRQYPQYGFARHKGYGSKAHFVALMEHGPSPIHRHSFRPVRESARLRLWSRKGQGSS
jgi:ribonuclease HII